MSFYVTDRRDMPTFQAVIRWRAASLWTAPRAGDIVMRQRIVLCPDHQSLGHQDPGGQDYPLAVECCFGERNGREQEIEMRQWAKSDLGIIPAAGTRVMILDGGTVTAEGQVN